MCLNFLKYKLNLFNKCLKESCFPDCWKVSSVVPVFKNVWEWSLAKNYRPVSLLSVVSKVFEKLVNNRIVDHLEKCGLFSDFQYGFRSSRSTADILTVVFDRIARVLNRSRSTRAVALDISKAFYRVWYAGLIHKLKSYRVSGLVFGLISSFLSNTRLRVVLDGKSSQEYPVNAGVPQGLVLHFSYYTLMTFLIVLSVILLSMLMILLSILSVTRPLICGNNLNCLLNLSLICETLDWGKKWLFDFNAGKTQLVSFDRSNNTGVIDVKMDGSVLEEKSSFKMLGLTFSSKLDWGSYIISYCKNYLQKNWSLNSFCEVCFS